MCLFCCVAFSVLVYTPQTTKSPHCSFCTSIVAQDAQGQIWHARNLDYDFSGYLKNITIGVHFTKNGKVCLSWADFKTCHNLCQTLCEQLFRTPPPPTIPDLPPQRFFFPPASLYHLHSKCDNSVCFHHPLPKSLTSFQKLLQVVYTPYVVSSVHALCCE